MRFLFQEQLLVACQTFGDSSGTAYVLSNGTTVMESTACKSGTHEPTVCVRNRFTSRIEQSKVESGRFRMYSHLGSTAAFVVFALVFAVAQAFRIIGSHDIGPTTYGAARNFAISRK